MNLVLSMVKVGILKKKLYVKFRCYKNSIAYLNLFKKLGFVSNFFKIKSGKYIVNFLYSNGISFYGFIRNYSKISKKFTITKKAIKYLNKNSKGLMVISTDRGVETSQQSVRGGVLRLLILS